jgi:hypothetical protein
LDFSASKTVRSKLILFRWKRKTRKKRKYSLLTLVMIVQFNI